MGTDEIISFGLIQHFLSTFWCFSLTGLFQIKAIFTVRCQSLLLSFVDKMLFVFVNVIICAEMTTVLFLPVRRVYLTHFSLFYWTLYQFLAHCVFFVFLFFSSSLIQIWQWSYLIDHFFITYDIKIPLNEILVANCVGRHRLSFKLLWVDMGLHKRIRWSMCCE